MNVPPQREPDPPVWETQSLENGEYLEDFEDTPSATWTRGVTEECLDIVSFAEDARRLLYLPLAAAGSEGSRKDGAVSRLRDRR